MRYVVHLRLPDDFGNYTLNYKRRLGALVEHAPLLESHCTLFSGMCAPAGEQQMLDKLGQVAQGAFPVQLTGELSLFSDNTLVARVERTPELHRFHQNVCEGMRNFIDWAETGLLSEEYAGDARKAAVFRAYGSPFFGEFYQPHVALAHMKQDVRKHLPLVETTRIPKYAWSVLDFHVVKKDKGWRHVRRFQLG